MRFYLSLSLLHSPLSHFLLSQVADGLLDTEILTQVMQEYEPNPTATLTRLFQVSLKGRRAAGDSCNQRRGVDKETTWFTPSTDFDQPL